MLATRLGSSSNFMLGRQGVGTPETRVAQLEALVAIESWLDIADGTLGLLLRGLSGRR